MLQNIWQNLENRLHDIIREDGGHILQILNTFGAKI